MSETEKPSTDTTDPAPEEAVPTPAENEKVTAVIPLAKERALGALLMLLGYGGAFLMMANSEQVFRGPLYGIFLCLLGTVGFVFLVDGPHVGRVVPFASSAFARKSDEPLFMAPVVTVPIAVVLAVALLMGLRDVHGFDAAAAIAVLAGLAVLALSAYRRPTLLLTVIVTAVYLPRLGAYPLWDPWETHYGEVAREILARDDWISLWWCQENWFFSKPIFIFWAEALSMGSFGFDASPDAHAPDPEWALRLPIFILSLLAVLAANALARRIAGARAGVLAGLVVATMPLFFMISHQAITDMPVVSCMTIAMCLLGLAITEDKEARIEEYAIGRFRWSTRRSALALLAMVGAPQLLYFLSRNVTWTDQGFDVHGELLLRGSAGNDGVPGNEPLTEVPPAFSAFLDRARLAETFGDNGLSRGLAQIDFVAPAWQAVWWGLLLALVVKLLRRDDKRQMPLMLGFYIFCALGFLAKGIPGFALPGLVALFFLVAAGRFRSLVDGELRVLAGVLTVVGLGLPWYIAMHIRHGLAFFDRILVHDHLNRLAAGVHGDTGSIEYFIGQLGYGTFPWIGLAPAAVLSYLWYKRRGEGERDRLQDGLVLVAMWTLSSFTLFSAMVTKFHHYIFPVVPPTGILIGIVLDRLVGDMRSRGREALVYVLCALSGIALVIGFAGLYGNVRGLVPEDVPAGQHADWVLLHAPPAYVVLLAFAVAAAGFLGSFVLARREGMNDTAPKGFAVVALGGAALASLVGRDLSWATSVRPAGYERIANLYTYKYDRAWPSYIDYRPILTGIAIAATIALIALAWPKLRAYAARALVGVAILFAAFGVNVYFPDVAPHWSCGPIVARYYAQRAEGEPLIAYQMNWKGENFYTGNRVFVFQDISSTRFTDWMSAHDRQPFYAILEHTRLHGFRTAVGIRVVTERSDLRFNNKFVLVHVTAARR